MQVPHYKKSPKIGVIGELNPSEEGANLAYEVGKELGKRNCVVICGGLGGVMEEVCRGAKECGALTIGILPGTESSQANPYVDIPIPTGMDQARNIIIVRSADSVIAIEGGYGTLSEIAYALKLHKPIIGLSTWKLYNPRYPNIPIIYTTSAEEAVKLAINFSSASVIPSKERWHIEE